jgi:V/A-type H+-transporting ATPase subunit I
MKHILVQALTEDLPQVSLTLAEVGVFAPDERSVAEEQFPIIPGERYRDLYNHALSRLDKLSRLLNIDTLPSLRSVRVVEESELDRLNSWLGEVWATGSSYEEQFRRLLDQERLLTHREESLENFASLNVDLGLLQGEKQFLNLFVGAVPRENVRQLEEALGLAGHLLYTFLVGLETVNVIIVGPRGVQEDELQPVLQAADFRSLPVPPDLRSQPDNIRREIQERRATLVRERQEVEAHLQSWGGSLRRELDDARRSLVMAEPFVRLDSSMRSAGSLGAVTGWVPARDVAQLEETLSKRLANPFLLTVRSPTEDERSLVPTMLRRTRLFAPFQDLIRQYGIPRYGEIDPTQLFSITFILMFGAMFGDIGQGGVIALAGWIFRAKLKRFARFVIYLGTSSVVFGFLYGSLFGYEEIIHPIWIAPISDPSYMLTVALMWGIGFIVMASVISIYNHMVIGERLKAIFGNHGMLSLLLYLSTLWGVYQMVQTGEFGTPAKILAWGSLAAVFAYSWHEVQAPLGERILVVVIESVEIIMGYISNTLSFLRVAAFSLNHMALAFAVFAIAEMMETTGHWITVVLGNIFVLILEGGIVTIQTMRLEYYEGFSRYFFGDGREYQPLTLGTSPAE